MNHERSWLAPIILSPIILSSLRQNNGGRIIGRRENSLRRPVVGLPQSVLHYPGHFPQSDGLGKNAEGPLLAGFFPNDIVEGSRDKDARQEGGELRLAEAADGIQAAQPRHVHVDDNDVNPLPLDNFEGLFTVPRQ